MAKNPFVDFKNTYAGKETIADKIIGNSLVAMEKTYLEAFNAIYVKINTARKDVNYCSYAKQTQLMKQIGAELDGLKKRSGSYLGKALKEIAKYGAKVAIADLQTIATNDVTHSEAWHKEYNLKYAEQMFKDNFEHIAAQTTKMKTEAKTQLRADAMRVFQYAATTGLSRKEAYYALKDEVLGNNPKFTFVDKAGKTWDNKNYFEMLTKTVMHNALRECYANTLINEGHDLVKVILNGAKDECKNWEGRILSLTGATPNYVTVADAKATKEVFHPRCRHRVVAYHESIEDVFKAIEDGKSDAGVLGFDPQNIDRDIAAQNTKNAHDKLDKLPIDPATGQHINPMTKAQKPMMAKMQEAKHEVFDEIFTKQMVDINSIRTTFGLVDKELVKKYIDNPSGIKEGMAINAYNINGKYLLSGGHMKVLAAKLLGAKQVELHVMDATKALADIAKAKAKKAAEAEAELKAQIKAKYEAEQAEYKAQESAELAKKAQAAKEKSLEHLYESDFERIGPQTGSNPGGLFLHKPSGEKFYIKIPKGDNQELKVKNEFAASKLYELAGVDCPKLRTMKMDNGNHAVVSPWSDGLTQVPHSPENFKKFYDGFATDAWLANWDTVGLDFDNIAFDAQGKPFRIDVGGSLLFRAQGGEKGNKFGNEVGELKTFIDESINPQSAKVFKGMTDQDLYDSIVKVTSLKMADILSKLKESGLDEDSIDKLHDTLFERKKFLESYQKGLAKKLAKNAPKNAKLDKIQVNYDDAHGWAFEKPTKEEETLFREKFLNNPNYGYGSGKFFNSQTHMKELKVCMDLHPNLTKIEAQAIVLYTNGAYGDLNYSLRKFEYAPDAEPETKAYAKILNNAILKSSVKRSDNRERNLPGVAGSVVGNSTGPWIDAKKEYYERKFGLNKEDKISFMNRYSKVGEETSLNTFLSTAQTRTSFTGNTHIYFKPRHGFTYVDGFSANSGEDEVIVPFGIKVRIIHTMKVPNDYGGYNDVIYMEEI